VSQLLRSTCNAAKRAQLRHVSNKLIDSYYVHVIFTIRHVLQQGQHYFNLLRSKNVNTIQATRILCIVPQYAAVLKCSWNDYNHQVSINLPHLLVIVYTLPSSITKAFLNTNMSLKIQNCSLFVIGQQLAISLKCNTPEITHIDILTLLFRIFVAWIK